MLLLALGDFLNIPALLLNILAWKLDFNFLRILFVLRMFQFPRSIFLFYESNIFKTLTTNRIWSLSVEIAPPGRVSSGFHKSTAQAR